MKKVSYKGHKALLPENVSISSFKKIVEISSGFDNCIQPFLNLLSNQLSKNTERLTITLERKIKEYKIICDWFDKEYDSSSSTDTVSEHENKATELDAQIKLLRLLLSNNDE